MSEAIAAMRNAPFDERAEFWRAIRDQIEDQVHPEAPEPRPAQAKAAPVVYFLRFSDRVKIGFSTNLAGRLRAIPHDEVLATIPGGAREERALHERFADLRVTGEWFLYEDPLRSFIEELR